MNPDPKDWGYALALALFVIISFGGVIRYLFKANREAQDEAVTVLKEHLKDEKVERRSDRDAFMVALKETETVHLRATEELGNAIKQSIETRKKSKS